MSGLLEAGTTSLLLATVAGFLGRLWWMFELASHFRVHLAGMLGGLFVIWWFFRRRRTAILCGVFAAVNAALVLPLLWPAAGVAPGAGSRLRLVAVNVHTANQRSDLVLEFLRGADADVILLMEVDDRWLSALEPLRGTHPHGIAEPRDDNFGIALFSRRPLTNCSVTELGLALVPSIEATLEWGGQAIQLLGTHPLPPGSAEYASLRNEQFLEIAAYVRRQARPTVVLGDLNATPWSPHFAGLLRDSGLRNSSQGRGLFASWPAWLPLGRIPLDHCLVPPAVQVVGKRLGPRIGSDHLPVVVDLQRFSGAADR
jgi:endonuclease/exonuclease/phosphatase (EEP) superfamily protein YafD